MQLFFFDVVEHARVLSDERGEVLVDAEAAIRQATMMARERAASCYHANCFIDVKDSSGFTIAKISVGKRKIKSRMN